MKKIFFITVLFLFSLSMYAQVPKYQAMFIYNFAQNIEWPAAYKSGDFKIAVLGGSPVIAELENLSKTYKVGNQKMSVTKFKSTDKIQKCHILFVPKNKSGEIGTVLAKVKSYNTLLITEKDGFARAGATINFVIRGGQLKFELNLANAKKSGLEVSQYLQNLGIMIK